MNIQEFIKAKEEELDGLGDIYTFPHNSCTYVSGFKPEENGSCIPLDGRNDTEVIKNLLSQSLLEYNEKIKEMIENKKATCLGNPEWMLSIEDRIKNETLDDIITNLNSKDNEKIT